MELLNEEFFPLSSRCYDCCKEVFLPIFIAAVVRETYPFIKIIQPISPNYNCENGVKQIRLLKKIFQKVVSCVSC